MPSHYRRTKRMLKGWAAVRFTAAQLFWLISGTALYAFAIRGFILPTHLLTGGVTGTAILGHAVFHWHVGLTVLLLNIPVFLLGSRDLGKRFAIYSGAAVLVFWIITDYSSIQPLTRDPMLGAIFGGLLGGMGSAFALRSGGSLGGFDILAVFFNRRFGLGVGEASLVLNGLLVIAAGFIEKPELAMYTLISIFVSSRTIDTLQAPRRRKAVLIISDESVSIRRRILHEMHRGATILNARGAFTERDRDVLLCIITRAELREMRDIVLSEDPRAFLTILEANEVVGRFRSSSARALLQKLAARPR